MHDAAINVQTAKGHGFRSMILRRPPFGRRTSVKIYPIDAPAEKRSWRLTTQDVKEFLMAYSACFLAVMGLIA